MPLIKLSEDEIRRREEIEAAEKYQVWAAHVSSKKRGEATLFAALFWVHQVIFGIPCAFHGLELWFEGKADGIVSLIGLMLVWIGGTLMWGLAHLMHSEPTYDLPPAIGDIAQSLRQIERNSSQA